LLKNILLLFFKAGAKVQPLFLTTKYFLNFFEKNLFSFFQFFIERIASFFLESGCKDTTFFLSTKKNTFFFNFFSAVL